MADSLFLIFLFIIFVVILLQKNENEIKLSQGYVTSVEKQSKNGTQYFAFLGIPYAKPPLGKLRFLPPRPINSLDDIKQADKQPPVCLQNVHFIKFTGSDGIFGQEDCLYLNVYTPQKERKSEESKLPVMVWIHPGAFLEGAGSFYQPDYFMDYPVVIVTINYRLGILGFLSTGDEIIPGNNGMKDQVAALKWVQKNIAAFGGDPNKVTIFGGSAGGASVHYHLLSPLSKGLFHRAISQSGTALAVWAQTSPQQAKERFQKLGELANCSSTSKQATVDCLKKISAEFFVQIYGEFKNTKILGTIPFSITPEIDSDSAFITENPWHYNSQSDIPWIVGINSEEGGLLANSFLSSSELMQNLNEAYRLMFAKWFSHHDENPDDDKFAEISDKIKQFYFKNEDINGEDQYINLVNLFTDILFSFNAFEAVQRYKGPVYFYYNNHRNNNTFNKFFGQSPKELGVCHGDELINLFHMPELFPKVEGDDSKVSEKLIKFWVNFATNGNPNSANERIWEPVQSEIIEYLHIKSKETVMEKNILHERYTFLKNLEIIIPSAQQNNNFKDEF